VRTDKQVFWNGFWAGWATMGVLAWIAALVIDLAVMR
jgi:hypothetical protein